MATESVIVLPPNSNGTRMRTVNNPTVAGGAHQEVVTLADEDGNYVMADLRRGRHDQRIRFDYGARTDGNPVYAARAVQGTADTSATWQIQRFTYDSLSRPIDIQVLTGAWADRATLGWS